jgi:hypothetical protein
METILITATFLIGLVLGLGAMVHFARHDRFAPPGTGYQPRDELGPLSHRRRAA